MPMITKNARKTNSLVTLINDMEHQDYYSILQLTPKASHEEIRQAYRRLARKFHPDVSQETDAEQQFKNISEAYEVLKDPRKRKMYDNSSHIIRPYTLAWVRVKIREQLRTLAQARARKQAQNRANAQMANDRPFPVALFVGGILIFLAIVIADKGLQTIHLQPDNEPRTAIAALVKEGNSMVALRDLDIDTQKSLLHALQEIEAQRNQQILIEAITREDGDSIQLLKKLTPEAQQAILQHPEVKKAIVNFYITQSDGNALTQLEPFDAASNYTFFKDSKVEQLLTAFYFNKMSEEIAADNFAVVNEWMEQLQNKYKSSLKLAEKRREIQQQKNRRLEELAQQYTHCLSSTRQPLTKKGNCAAEVRHKVAAVAPEHSLLNEPLLPRLYSQAVTQALGAKQYQQAQEWLNDWQKNLPEPSATREALAQSLLRTQQAEELTADLRSGDRNKVLNALSQLENADKSLQNQVFQNPELQKVLLDHYLKEAMSLMQTQGGSVQTYLENILRTNPDSPTLNNLKQALAGIRNKRRLGQLSAYPTPTEETTVSSSAEPITRVQTVAPVHPETEPAHSEKENVTAPTPSPVTPPKNEAIATQLQECKRHFQANRLTRGKNSALECYQRILQRDPLNIGALSGLKELEDTFQVWTESALNQREMEKAKSNLEALRRINPRSEALDRLEKRLQALKMPTPVTPPTASTVPEKKPTPTGSPTPPVTSPPKPVLPSESPPTTKPVNPVANYPPKATPPSTSVPKKDLQCDNCDCTKLLTQLSIGVKPLTAEQSAFIQANCQ